MVTGRAEVRIVEVGPRDGLQNVSNAIPLETKVALIERLAETGLSTVELTSNVSAAAVPQLKDGLPLLQVDRIQAFLRDNSRRFPVLVPNVKRLDAVIKTGVREVAVFISATEGFSRANIRCTVDEGLAGAKLTTAAALKAGLAVRGYISCIFADPFDGPTAPSAVLKCVQTLLAAGCYEISLGDTLGVGTAAEVSRLLNYLIENGIPIERLAGHFHDTYGQGVSNVWTAYKHGVRVFDSSVGGLGGCPFAPGAKGNVSTEDVVWLFHQAGISTGVDLPKLAAVGDWICKAIPVQNCSRAGPAILSVQARKSSTSPTKHSSRRPGIQWELQSGDDNRELLIYRAGSQIKIVLNRPKNGNALTTSMIQSLCDFLRSAKDDPSISHIVITATGRFFCTGMDLSKSGTPVGAQSTTERDAQYTRLITLLDLIDSSPQVTVAAINGAAFGGGVGLAFACDVRVADPKATFTMSEARLGLCPATISKYVVREWGFAFSRQAMLSALPVTAARLFDLGVIAGIATDSKPLPALLDDYLQDLSRCAPGASAMCKQLVRLGWQHAASKEQEDGIKSVFDEMMKPENEGAFGVAEFQKGNKEIDWTSRTKKKRAAKL